MNRNESKQVGMDSWLLKLLLETWKQKQKKINQ